MNTNAYTLSKLKVYRFYSHNNSGKLKLIGPKPINAVRIGWETEILSKQCIRIVISIEWKKKKTDFLFCMTWQIGKREALYINRLYTRTPFLSYDYL